MRSPPGTTVFLAITSVLLACGGSPTDTGGGNGDETGSIQVNVVTTGEDQDTGYSISANNSTQAVGANGSVTFSNVPVGSHSVDLGGVASNCTVTGGSSRTVTVTAGESASVDFAVTCEATSGGSDSLADAIQALEDALYVAANIDEVADLDSFSFQEAHDLFAQALAESPSNDTAAFGLAITTIFLLEDNSQVRGLAEDWEVWLEEDDPPLLVQSLMGPAISVASWKPAALPLDLSVGDIRQVAYASTSLIEMTEVSAFDHAPPPSLTESQTVLSDIVAPAIEEASAALAQITDVAFEFTVTPRMQGEEPDTGEPLELDYTEVLVLKAGLEVALGAIGTATAYVFEPNPLDPDGFVSAMTPGSTFLTLAPDGAALLGEVPGRLQAGADHLLAALDNLEGETDDQADDIIKYDGTGSGEGQTSADIADARAIVEDVDAALSGPAAVTIGEAPDETTFTLDAREFFVDPIADLKSLFPDYEVFTATEDTETVAVFRWTALNLDDWIVPDPTFSGILPDIASTQDLIDTFEALDFAELFFEASLAEGFYELITVDGLDCYEDWSNGGSGCPVGSEFYYEGYLALGEGEGMPSVAFTASGTGYRSATGTYDVADAGGGTYTVSMDLVDDASMSLMLTGSLDDMPGYTSVDGFGRRRGGSTVTLSYLGSEWVFEKQD